MRYFLLLSMFFIYGVSFAAKPDTVGLWRAVYGLNDALKQKDTNALKKLLHPKLYYCHSNGWCETKGEVIHDLFGVIDYKEIGMIVNNWEREKNFAFILTTMDVSVRYNNNDLSLRLFLMQVWKKNKKQWQLIARQSTKL